MPKLPKYVFQRANGSYRYKRNVPVSLRQVIPKATVYRQLGTTYDEAIRRLPKVHSEIEALFDLERRTTPSQRALKLVRERIGAQSIQGWVSLGIPKPGFSQSPSEAYHHAYPVVDLESLV